MHKTLLSIGISAVIFTAASNPASAQKQTTATPVFDAMLAGIEADPRVKELKALDPEKLVSEATYMVQWPMVHERDLYWKCRIHRVVDFRDERNKALIATVQGKSDLGEILVKGVMDDRYKAYGAHDDRLTHSISRDSVSTLLTNAGISETSGRRIEKFLVKQDWLYLWPEKKLVSRIICIAPLLESIETDGTTKDVPLFWLYYSSVRPYLRDYRLPLVDGSPHNLDELFEQWKFNSTIRSVQKYEPLELMNYLTPAKREYMLSRD